MAGVEAQAQEHEIGGWAGVANFFGSINTTFSWKHVEPAGGLFYRYNIGKRFAAKAMVSYGEVAGSDATSPLAWERQRNLSFKSTVTDVCGTFEFNFFKWNKNNPKHNGFTPYIASGFGMFFFNPEAFYKGKWYYLQPLGTEGQNDPSYSGVKKYKLYAFEIPLEGGFKIHVKKNWNVNVFASVRETFTKYMDDVSGTYASNASLPGGSRGIAAALADRSGEVNDGVNIGNPRLFSHLRFRKLVWIGNGHAGSDHAHHDAQLEGLAGFHGSSVKDHHYCLGNFRSCDERGDCKG